MDLLWICRKCGSMYINCPSKCTGIYKELDKKTIIQYIKDDPVEDIDDEIEEYCKMFDGDIENALDYLREKYELDRSCFELETKCDSIDFFQKKK